MRRRALTSAIVASLVVLAFAAPGSAAKSKARTPIEHMIVLMQENHSFDNYFGTYPGADGIPKGLCMPVDPADPSRRTEKGERCVKPYRIGSSAVQDLQHNDEAFNGQLARGKMNGFIAAQSLGGRVARPVMGHYDDRDLPFYWNVADNFVLFDRFFTSAAGGSVWNHMYWVAGHPGNPKDDLVPPGGFDKVPTIFDRLEKAGVSWKFYVQNYDPGITFRTPGKGDRGSQVVWVPLLNYARYLDNPRLFGKIVDLEEYYKDLERGTLPEVAYIAPAGSSEHPPGSIQAGESFVRGLTSSLMRSSAWKSSAFIWTYDDWGGWYDHVKPPKVDRFGYGFRAPALLMSSYAKRGAINHDTLDFTSILKFIEENWGLRPLASRDRRAKSIAGAFDFSQGPREAVFLDERRHVKAEREPRRFVVYAAYILAALMTIGMIGRAATRRGRVKEPVGAGREQP